MRFRRTFALAALAACLPLTANAAPSHSPSHHFRLQVSKRFQGKIRFMHVMASGTLRYSAHDAFINLSTDNLPKPSTLGKKVYVVYVSDMAMTERLGVLHGAGTMAGIRKQVMMTHLSDVYVYAQNSATAHPHGILVLSAMV